MEFPSGHHGHHRHHHRRDEEEEEEQRFDRPPPPSQYGENTYGQPDYPPVQHVSHQVGGGYGPPDYPPVQHASHQVGGGYGPPDYPPVQHASHEVGGGYGPPGYPSAQHVSHEVGSGYEPPPPFPAHGGYGREEGHQHRPYSSPVEHVSHESWEGGGSNRQPTVRIFTKAREDYSLSVRQGKVVLVPANPRDEHQHWIKDMKYSTKVKDEEGFPSFALVNKVTGEAIKHSVGATHPVRLVPYNPDYLDESFLWTESNDTGEGFRCIRMVNNIRLNFDAFNGDEDHGGVRDGTTVVLWEWAKGKNQRWKIVPY